MSNSKQTIKKQGTQPSETPKGVLVELCSLDDAKPVCVGDVTYMPFPRRFNLTLKRGADVLRQIVTSECNPRSFRVASWYKFGGADGDCVGDAKVYGKNADGKRVFKRDMTKAEIVKAMDDRLQGIKDGTYIGVAKARGIPIPPRIEEAALIVQAKIKADRAWLEGFYTPVRSRAMSEKDAMISLATTLSSHGSNAVASPDRVAKCLKALNAKVDKNLASRVEFEWEDDDNDLIE